jgi:hypothetical protein
MNSHEEDDVKSNDPTIEEQQKNASNDQNESKSCSPLPRLSSGITRYGRMVKTKSPSTVILDSPKACIT